MRYTAPFLALTFILVAFPLRGARLAQMQADVLALHAQKQARLGRDL